MSSVNGRPLPLFEIARVLVRLDYVTSIIVNSITASSAAAMLGGIDGIASRVWPAIPQPAEWQRIGNQIDAAMISARSNMVKMCLGELNLGCIGWTGCIRTSHLLSHALNLRRMKLQAH